MVTATGHRPVFLHGIASELGEARDIKDLPEIAADPDTEATLRHLGLSHYARSAHGVTELAYRTCRQTLARAQLEGKQVDGFVFATSSFTREENYRSGLRALHANLGLSRAHPTGLFGSECSNLVTALRTAVDMLIARQLEHVLVVTSDRAEGGGRLMDGLVSVFSDGAASCLLSARPTCGFAVDAVTLHCSTTMFEAASHRTLLAYLQESMNGAATTMRHSLQQLNASQPDFKRLLTGNYNRSVLKTYASHLGFEEKQMYSENVARFAHCYAADTLINLQQLSQAGDLVEGDRALLFGSGQNTWGTAAVRFVGREAWQA